MKPNNIQYLTAFVLISQLWGPLSAANIDPQVQDKITNTGQAPVIISLYDPVPLDAPSASSCDSLSRLSANRNCIIGRVDAVALVQEYVLSQLPINSLTLKHRYSHVPALAGTITQAALDILANHPQVFSVNLDDIDTIQLAESVPLIQADSVHQMTSTPFTGNGITVAVIDTGIDTDHPDLADSYCWTTLSLPIAACPPTNTANESNSAEDDQGHGTHVSGIITAKGSVAPKGTAPDAQIVAVKVCNASGSCPVSDAIKGLDWLLENITTQPIQIVNLSLASTTIETLYQDICDTANQAYADAVNLLVTQGVTVFAASGNKGCYNRIGRPACLSNTIAIGATYDSNVTSKVWGTNKECQKDSQSACIDTSTADQIGCFSNSNYLLDILAPGAMITSSKFDGTTDVKGGTSQASPMAAGVAALMLEANSSLTPNCIKNIMQQTGVNILDSRNNLSFPRIDALLAVEAARQGIFQFVANNYQINENSGSITIEVGRIGNSYGAVSVDYTTIENTATEGNDYTAVNGTLTWNDGDMALKTFTVNIIDDSEIEGDEIITLNLYPPTDNACLGLKDSAILTITDYESGRLQFSSATKNINENSGSVTIEVTRTNGSDGTISVDYATVYDSATQNSDYTQVSGILSWADGETTSQFMTINITNDDIFENDESFQVTLSNPTGGASIGTTNPVTITITNDDEKTSSKPSDTNSDETPSSNISDDASSQTSNKSLGLEPLPHTMMTFVEVNGTGSGHVSSDPIGIDCQPNHCTRVSYKDDPTGMKCNRNYCAKRFETATY
ncbi:Peptidase S8 and S53, subtilisin, kexin, sedolisin [Beggiatoa sp. PS]|nr:Peptidase S8 and S53, subtilisin, kexin, sedolisin [Beggiatoa sp. PS]